MNRVNVDGMPVLAPTPRRSKGGRKPRVRRVKVRSMADWFRLVMTIGLGTGIPMLSLAMSKIAGTLARDGMYLLALFALTLMMSVLGVSLAHVAWAVQHITRSTTRASWALAVALDLSLVLTELVHVYAGQLGLWAVCYAVMGAVALVSMAANVYAFLFADVGHR
jgi:hypothetical protein